MADAQNLKGLSRVRPTAKQPRESCQAKSVANLEKGQNWIE